MNSYNIFLSGVGGQGTVLASDVIAETALAAGYDVKKADVMGMAQRGGSVVSHIRFGPQVFSPLIASGQADVLVGFEKLEAARWASALRPGGLAIVNDQATLPLSVTSGASRYPTDAEIDALLSARTDNIDWVPALRIAEELGNLRVSNVVVLGFFSRLLPIDEALWLEQLIRRVPKRFTELNREAFRLGRAAASFRPVNREGMHQHG